MPLTPARYALTELAGAIFDPGTSGSSVPRPEPALYEGVRLLVDGGGLVGAARAPSGEAIAGVRRVMRLMHRQMKYTH